MRVTAELYKLLRIDLLLSNKASSNPAELWSLWKHRWHAAFHDVVAYYMLPHGLESP